jgi:hypothetical protein
MMESKGGGIADERSCPRSPVMDMHEFDKNRLAFPPEDLLQYRGKYIAWSPDGKRIVASDEDPARLDNMVQELGYDPSEVVFSSVPDGDSFIGGAWIAE